jgi:hypothetical protein
MFIVSFLGRVVMVRGKSTFKELEEFLEDVVNAIIVAFKLACPGLTT